MSVAVLAVAGAAACAPLNPGYRANEYEFYLSDLQAKALIIQVGSDSPAAGVAHELGIPIIELIPGGGDASGLFLLSGARFSASMAPGLPRPDDTALVLHTSGTTSRPKIVPLSQRNVCASADHIRRALALDERDRCLNVMPLFHIHGLMVTFASLLAGGSVGCTPTFDMTRFFAWMDELRPTWYTAVPTIHQAVLSQAPRHTAVIASARLRFIRSSAAALPPQVMLALEEVFDVPVIEGYGQTESALHVASNPLPPALRKPGSVGVPSGPEVAILDTEGNHVPPGQTGEIAVRGPNVFTGYERNPGANEAAFVDGWFRTGDLGRMDADGYLHITGRLKEIINRGGEKVSPREVDEVLLDHPAVSQAVAFAAPHLTLGEDVAAAVVLRQPLDDAEATLRTFATARLADFKVPRRILIVDELPKGPTGKVERLRLAELLGPREGARSRDDRLQTRPDFKRPISMLEHQLVHVWEQLLDVRPIGVGDRFFELGGDSLLAARMMEAIGRECGRTLSAAVLFEGDTIAHLAQLLRAEAAESFASPVTVITASGSKPPFFFCHGDRLGTGFYCSRIATYLGPEQPFYALHPHGLDGQPVPPSIEEMAADRVVTLRSVQPRGPYALGGFCNGALVALELARLLVAAGERVDALVLLEPPAANVRASMRALRRLIGGSTDGPGEGTEPFLRWRSRLLRASYYGGRALQLTGAGIDEWLAVAKRTGQRLVWSVRRPSVSPDPAEVPGASSDRCDRMEQAYAQAIARYVPHRYPGRLTVFYAEESWDPAAARRWRRLAAEMDLHIMSGSHTDFVTKDVHVFAARLAACLDRTVQRVT